MTNLLTRLVPGVFGLLLIAFAVVEISAGEFYPRRGGRIVVAARSPVSFRVLTGVELAAGVFLIAMTLYGLRRSAKR